MRTVDLGDGQFFTYETREQLGAAIAVLGKAIVDPTLDDRGCQYVDFDTAYVALRDYFRVAKPPVTTHKALSRRTSRLWGVIVSATNMPNCGDTRLTYRVICAKCGPEPVKAQHDIYGVWHVANCPVLNKLGFENYLVARDSILDNAADFATFHYAGTGDITRQSYQALVEHLRS